jgi:NAD(P)-dependent dehydrogenase (short-subunit alcohol dehydrogenase family)
MAIVVITGTSTGIGFAAALVLGRGGHDVFATMRHPDCSPDLQSIAARESLPITVLPLDVDRDDSVKQAIEQIMAARGRIDVLINNAGISSIGSVELSKFSVFRQTMETNFFGALRCIQAVLPGMRTRQSGCIINMSSVCGRIPLPAMSAYCASKFAIEAMSEALAAEVKAYNIRVAIVEPGVIETPIFNKQSDLPADSPYPQLRRQNAIFAASLQQHVPPTVVGELIRCIIEGNSWQLRYPAGPGASDLLAWRASLSDENLVQLFGTPDEEAFCNYVFATFGLNVRPYLL